MNLLEYKAFVEKFKCEDLFGLDFFGIKLKWHQKILLRIEDLKWNIRNLRRY